MKGPSMASEKTQIVIAIPAYDRKLYTDCAASLIALDRALRAAKIEARFLFLPGDPVVQRVRNLAVADVLGDRDATHLLFIDADVRFQPATILRLIKFGEPVVGAAYPKKSYPNERTQRFAPRDLDDFHRAVQDYSVVFDDPKVMSGEALPQGLRGDFAPVQALGAGLLLIRRDALQALSASLPDLKYRPDIPHYVTPQTAGHFYGLFDPFVDPETRTFVAEDHAFFRRWRGLGHTVWCDLAASLDHVGNHTFSGSLAATLKTRREALKKGS
ncbi:hypothetical protein E8L99_15085 [Phreatobacter aquaticus]|uniref:Glycosyltransferase family 2 protein n=1 Tax=Phreatobacter aquaticus TaxID=2570229 RepID=A0A4D7QPY4_9HYPH|nr:hypothetical protein [Phreatobacter aquaticus]QCK86987.1 hypothetical protein E8L99_15085 [Phreatobacter aquaticus]